MELISSIQKQYFQIVSGTYKIDIMPSFIPSVFSQYGVPINETIISIIYNNDKNNKLRMDNFYFRNIEIKRNYFYTNELLDSVIIRVKIRQKQDQFF